MYNEIKPGNRPIYVKVINKKDSYFIYTDEYEISAKIKQEISLIKNIPFDSIKLYYPNKRLIEDIYTNHDQEVNHGTILYACFKTDGLDFEQFTDVVL